jgi:hypothetical protein
MPKPVKDPKAKLPPRFARYKDIVAAASNKANLPITITCKAEGDRTAEQQAKYLMHDLYYMYRRLRSYTGDKDRFRPRIQQDRDKVILSEPVNRRLTKLSFDIKVSHNED